MMVKKCLNISLAYAIAGMACGVFFREFTKYNDFGGQTMLSFAHVHLLGLGTLVFLIVALFAKSDDFSQNRMFKNFMVIYNVGLPLTVAMMLVRGVLQVLNMSLSKGLDASVSGIAGLGHIVLAAGIVHLVIALKRAQKAQN